METLYERRTHSEQSAVWIDPLQSLDDQALQLDAISASCGRLFHWSYWQRILF